MARPFHGGTIAGVESISAATTLGKSDSGKVFMITDSGGSGYPITLPTPANAGVGFHAKFIVNVAAGATLNNSGGEDVILSDGQSDVMVTHFIDANSDVVTDDASDTIAFDNTAVKGDFIELFTDGSIYYAYGVSGVNAGITVAT